MSETQTDPEAVVGTSVSEVDDKLKRFVIEWLECQKNMVDQQVAIHIKYSVT